MTRLIVVFALGALAGCGYPAHLQYDHGRAMSQTLATQADLTRPSAATSAYALTGVEGLELRQRVVEESTDAETGEAEAVESIAVQ